MGLRIVLLGAPGAGKGTQAKRIAAKWSLPHISTGDIFRAHLREGTDLGKRVKEYLDAGSLVPDELTCEIVADRLEQPDCSDGYVLDGFPRTIEQAAALEQVLSERGEELDIAIDIEVDDDEIIERLTARRSCPECGRIYNMKFDPPREDSVCDDDGAKLIQRKDDQEQTIRERLRVYHETTEPIIEFYDKRGKLKSISGRNIGPDKVFEKVERIISALGSDITV